MCVASHCGKKGIEIPEGRTVYSIAVHGDRVAYVFGYSKENSWKIRRFVDCGGKVFGPYQMVHDLRWSDDGKRIMYEASTNEGKFSFNGDRKEGPYKSGSRVYWSPDGSTAVRCSNEYVYSNGKKCGPLHYPGEPVWSPDGKSYILQVLLEHGSFNDRELIIDGEMNSLGGFIDSSRSAEFIWSRTRHAFVYIKTVGNQDIVPCIGKEAVSFPDGTSMSLASWSPDGERLAYVTRGESSEMDETLVIDGTEIEKFSYVNAFYWAPDSSRYAVSARRNGSSCLYIDGKTIGTFDGIGEFVWSTNTAKYAFIEMSAKDNSYKVHGSAFEKESFSDVHNLRWAGNGTKLFFIGEVGKKCYVYFGNGKYGPFPSYDSDVVISISPDGMHFALIAGSNERIIVSDSGIFGSYKRCYIDEWSAKGGTFSYEYEKDGKLYHAVSGKEPSEISQYYASSAYPGTGVWDDEYIDVDDNSIIFSRGKRWVGVRENDKIVYVKDGYIVTEYGLD